MYSSSMTGKAVSTMDMETPVPYAKVVIYMANTCNSTARSECWIPIDSTFADANGWFTVDYEVPEEHPVMFAKGYQDQYFERADAVVFRRSRDSLIVPMIPKTYFKVHIEDEYPYDYSKYVGMWVRHYAEYDTLLQFPLDSTIITEGTPVPSTDGSFFGLTYALVYDRPNTIGSINFLPVDGCPPFDTCEVWIKF